MQSKGDNLLRIGFSDMACDKLFAPRVIRPTKT
jgi:hypothetical protein